MQPNMLQGKWRQIPTRKRPHRGILTLDDLDKRNWKHSQLIIQLRTRFKSEKKQGQDKPNIIAGQFANQDDMQKREKP